MPQVEPDTTVIEEFPEEHQAGRTYGRRATRWERMRDERVAGEKDKWGGFGSQDEWELARWIMKSGLSQGEIDKYLKLRIKTQRQKLGFHNKRKFFKIIDDLPTNRIPEFEPQYITVEGTVLDAHGNRQVETLEMWKRNPVEVIREIIGNPALKNHMHYSPVKVFADGSCDEQIFNEMRTAEWWWDVQYELPKGSTIVPVIVASDATRLSQFGGDKMAWPVYLTIGNVDKAIRRKPSWRATVLLGYLPVSKLHCFKDSERTEQRRLLFHYAMSAILAPLKEAGLNGVEMTCADGYVRRIHPILAAYIADFPEQCLIACCKESRCPKCKVKTKNRGNLRRYPPRRTKETLDILEREYHGQPSSAEAQGVRTDVLAPFWADLPYADVFSCITPDILHQLHKGVFKDHLVQWCSTLVGAEELDKRLKAMTTHAGLRQFKQGISVLKQWTGTEAKHLEKVFLGALAGAVDERTFHATRAVIDFIYYSQFSSHSTTTLQYMEDALIEFHRFKDVFTHHNIREHFNIPKLHSMVHYVPSIWTHGTLDGYNTELPERLHINLAKEGYRASNRRDYEAQMVRWLQRQESVDAYTAFLQWVLPDYEAIDFEAEDDEEEEEEEMNSNDILYCPPGSTSWQGQTVHTVAKHVPLTSISVQEIETKYGAVDFIPCLRDFISQNLPHCHLVPREGDVFDLYKRVKLQYKSLQGFEDSPAYDTIRATPSGPPPRLGRRPIPAYFDTALVDRHGEGEITGFEGVDVVQVRVIFKVPPEFGNYPHVLAYVEYFTGRRIVSDTYGMWVVRRAMQNNCRKAGIIKVSSIRSAVHLYPQFGRVCNPAWTSENVLEECRTFFVNPYLSQHHFNALSVPYNLGNEPQHIEEGDSEGSDGEMVSDIDMEYLEH
ncbi:hypothetical protein M422DRAFT_229030 [Sphaerobolus stellatus SS14]|uniref:Uncharacterized protein n=1 Tax=Sphaerobolus stellatus (strain SS14) TaxID=990650 RepID=A0A0C9VXJ3_SPHS4|nr:hypothetical protein M422DRAFT_229030 [Sphaerobolus stellatus SS14]